VVVSEDDVIEQAQGELSSKLAFSGVFFSALIGVVLANYFSLEKLQELTLIDTIGLVLALGFFPVLVFQVGEIFVKKASILWTICGLSICGFFLFGIYSVTADFPMPLRRLMVVAMGSWMIISVYLGVTSRLVRRHLF
jgi:hypothetical protein